MPEPLREDAEVVVVGAGIIGLAIAFELARAGRHVLVLERAHAASGATSAAGGMLAPISEADIEREALLALALDSLRRYPRFVAEVEEVSGLRCGLRTEGTLWVAVHRDDQEELAHLQGTLRERGLPCEVVTSRQVAAMEPHLSPRVLGGLRVDSDHQVDPRALARALAEGVRRLGGRLRTGAAVHEVGTAGGRVSGVSGVLEGGQPFTVRCGAVVIAAGAWTSATLRLPIADPGVRPVKGQLLRLRGASPLLRHVVRHPDVYLVPREDGELLVGATMEEVGFDPAVTAGAMLDLLRHAFQVVPGIYDLELGEVSVGFRSAVRDHQPVLGPTEVPGLHLAVGHFRNGILLAPVTAALVAGSLLQERILPELTPFLGSRLQVPLASR
ncbi:MAG TPA: glycine oxidase ThiO [Candidatus Polarisedimenticolaceae bacterium]|nr:glycine oxidase ThiO [Candidatus Polarisedimenticolaceae bacterium]